jgi:hypothetical protein
MNKPREKVLGWLESGDFKKGIDILMQHRPAMARMLQKGGERRMSKLSYELKKIAGIDRIDAKVKPAVIQPTHNFSITTPKQEINSGKTKDNRVREKQVELLASAHKSLEEVPADIERVAREHARLFMLRSQLSDQRYELPQRNDPDTVKNRRVITQSIHELSDRIELLFGAHSAYMRSRELPDMKRLFPLPEGALRVENTPGDNLQRHDQMSKADLKKRRSALMDKNRRDRLILNYSGPKQLKRKNPLPDGDERTLIETRVTTRQEEINYIEQVLKKL